jgi:Putative metallopeptidase
MTNRIFYRSHLAGAMTLAALIVNVPPAIAQAPAPQFTIGAGIEEAVKALDSVPQLKHLSPEEKKRLVEFVIGNTLFAMAHELGHGLINEMNIPVVGREEDAADSFAIVTALKLGSAYSESVLIEAGKGQVLSSKEDKKEGNALAFYDEHGLDLQRAYNIVCYMFGSNPEKYKRLAVDTKLPDYRQAACPYEWNNVAWSWDELLKKHLRSADQPKVKVTINYEDNKKFAVQEKLLRHMGLLEDIAAHAADRYAWPKPWTIEARSCGDPNARWKERVLILCYELAGEFIELYEGYEKTLSRKLRDLH